MKKNVIILLTAIGSSLVTSGFWFVSSSNEGGISKEQAKEIYSGAWRKGCIQCQIDGEYKVGSFNKDSTNFTKSYFNE